MYESDPNFQKIKQYLLENQQYPIEELAKQLLNSGIQQAEIDEAINSLRAEHNPPDKSFLLPKKKTIIKIVILLFIIAIPTYYIWKLVTVKDRYIDATVEASCAMMTITFEDLDLDELQNITISELSSNPEMLKKEMELEKVRREILKKYGFTEEEYAKLALKYLRDGEVSIEIGKRWEEECDLPDSFKY